jgi:hypothetical protein
VRVWPLFEPAPPPPPTRKQCADMTYYVLQQYSNILRIPDGELDQSVAESSALQAFYVTMTSDRSSKTGSRKLNDAVVARFAQSEPDTAETMRQCFGAYSSD